MPHADEITRPPRVRGVTQFGERRDPFDSFLEALSQSPDQGVASDAINDAINLLLQAGDADPAIRPIVGPAIAFLTEGPSRPPRVKSREQTGFTTPLDRLARRTL